MGESSVYFSYPLRAFLNGCNASPCISEMLCISAHLRVAFLHTFRGLHCVPTNPRTALRSIGPRAAFQCNLLELHFSLEICTFIQGIRRMFSFLAGDFSSQALACSEH